MKLRYLLNISLIPLLLQGISPEDRKKPFNQVRMIMTHNATSVRPRQSKAELTMDKSTDKLPPKIKEKVRIAISEFALSNPNPVADQSASIEKQLNDGIRGFKLPVSKVNNEFRFCHTIPKEKAAELYDQADERLKKELPDFKFVPTAEMRKLILKPLEEFKKNPCLIDTSNQPLTPILTTINNWLNQHPDEVFALFLDFSQFSAAEKEANIENIKKALTESGLFDKMLIHKPNTPWPTIDEMIKTGKRVVITANTDVFESIGIYHKKDQGFGSNYDFKTLQDLKTDSDNPQIGWGGDPNPVTKQFIIDSYTTPAIAGSIVDARTANSSSVLKNRLKNYEKMAKQPITFVMIDFYQEPNNDVFKVIEDLNKGI